MKIIGLCVVLLFATLANSNKIDGEIDYKEEHGFNVLDYPEEYFLSPLPLHTLRTMSYTVRQSNPFSNDPRIISNKPDMAYSKVYLHGNDDNKTKGFIQFRQISDMWFTEIKGVVENLEPNSSYLLTIHQNPTSKNVKRGYCQNLGDPFHYIPLNVDLRNIRKRKSLGDLGMVTSNNNGTGVVNLNAVYTSLFGGSGTILGKSLGLHKLNGEKVSLSAFECGDIDSAVYAPATFRQDLKQLDLKKINTITKVSTSSTPEPDFDKPPSF